MGTKHSLARPVKRLMLKLLTFLDVVDDLLSHSTEAHFDSLVSDH